MPYSRLHTWELGIAEYQPIAPDAMLNLLSQTIEQTEALISAMDELIAIVEAGLREQRLARLRGKGKAAETING